MLRELWATLKDTLEYGDLVGHLRSFARVASGQISPFHAACVSAVACSSLAQHNPGGGGAAQPEDPSPRPPFSLCSRSTPAGSVPGAAGGDPRAISITPICTIYSSGQVEVVQ